MSSQWLVATVQRPSWCKSWAWYAILVAVQQLLVSDKPELAVLSSSTMKFIWFLICMLGNLAMDIGTQQAKLGPESPLLDQTCFWAAPSAKTMD